MLWTAYVLLPAAGWGWFHGVPMGVFGAVTLFLVWWTWSFDGPLPGRWLLAALLVAKLALSFLMIERGLEADYFANPTWTPPSEHHTDSPLSFGRLAARDLPAGVSSATWRGYVWNRSGKDRQLFYLHGNGLSAELWIDGAQTVSLDPTRDEAVDRARWPAGMRQVTVRVNAPAGDATEFEAGFIDERGRKTPFADPQLLTRAFAQWRIVVDRVFRVLSTIVDSVLLAALLVCALVTFLRACSAMSGLDRRNAWMALGWLAAFCGALSLAAPAAGRIAGFERSSSLLYARILPLVQRIFGADLFGILLIHFLLLWVTALLVWRISARLFGERIGTATLIVSVAFLITQGLPMARLMTSKNLLMPCLCLLLFSLVALITSSRDRAGLVALVLSTGALLLLGAEGATRSVDRFPAGLAMGRFLYAAGFFGAFFGGTPNSPVLIGIWSASLIGMMLLVSPVTDAGTRGSLRWLPAALSAIYLLAAITIGPRVYGDPVILPAYVLLLPYVAIAAAQAAGVMTRHGNTEA